MLGYTGDDFIMTPLQSGKPVTFHIAESTKRNGINLILFNNCALNLQIFSRYRKVKSSYTAFTQGATRVCGSVKHSLSVIQREVSIEPDISKF